MPETEPRRFDPDHVRTTESMGKKALELLQQATEAIKNFDKSFSELGLSADDGDFDNPPAEVARVVALSNQLPMHEDMISIFSEQ